jgi:hypothetical protein
MQQHVQKRLSASDYNMSQSHEYADLVQLGAYNPHADRLLRLHQHDLDAKSPQRRHRYQVMQKLRPRE